MNELVLVCEIQKSTQSMTYRQGRTHNRAKYLKTYHYVCTASSNSLSTMQCKHIKRTRT